MTVQRTRSGFDFHCDACDAAEFAAPRVGAGSAPREFNACWALAREEGWRAAKNHDGTWQHTCPDCRENER
jgi:hypothetical protein